MTTSLAQTTATAAEFGERLFGAVLGTQLVQAVYLGDRLGYYRVLADGEPLTSGRAGRPHRDAPSATPASGWSTRPCAACSPWTTSTAAAHRPPLPAAAGPGRGADRRAQPEPRAAAGPHASSASAGTWTRWLDAYRSGGGVGWAELGTDAREAQAAANRPLFLGALPRDYLPSVPEINAVLDRGGRVADVGCGFGWSAIGLALAHPEITVDGYDLDAPSIEAARRNAVEAGVADRVRFHLADAAAVTAGTTWSPRSSASTTCRTRCRCWPRCAGWPGRTAWCW